MSLQIGVPMLQAGVSTRVTSRAVAAPAHNATLVGRNDITDSLAGFSVSLDEPMPAFAAGQYVALGIATSDGLVQRPYSIASPPDRRHELEFFIRREHGGAFTTPLWRTPLGTRLRVGPPKGLFTLPPTEPRHRLFVATGTGLAPFLAMIAAERTRGDSPGVTLLHGVAYGTELGHRERLAAWRHEGLPLSYVPTVSRPADEANAGWDGAVGRVDRLLDEVCTRRGFDATNTVVYLCGSPAMVETCRALLEGRGFGPSDVRAELFQAVARAVRRPAVPQS